MIFHWQSGAMMEKPFGSDLTDLQIDGESPFAVTIKHKELRNILTEEMSAKREQNLKYIEGPLNDALKGNPQINLMLS